MNKKITSWTNGCQKLIWISLFSVWGVLDDSVDAHGADHDCNRVGHPEEQDWCQGKKRVQESNP
jgi:hypothetical protein